MKNIVPRNNPLYFITDTSIAGLSHYQIVKKAVSAGVKTVQLRDKQMTKRDLYYEALKVRDLTAEYQVKLIINDHIDIAMTVRADGVHLGQNDMPVEEARRLVGKRVLIGVSTHNLSQAERAEKSGADYIGFGPIFQTATKDAGNPKGLKALQNICSIMHIPVIAIGGITSENIRGVMNTGAHGCAAISSIQKGSMSANVQRILTALGS